MKCHLNENISDFHTHKNIAAIQAAGIYVNEALKYVTSNLNTSFKPYCFKGFTVSNSTGQATNVKAYIPLYLSLVKNNKCQTGKD